MLGEAHRVGQVAARGVILLGGQARRVRERDEMFERAEPLAGEQAASGLAGLVEGSEDMADAAGADVQDLLAERLRFIFGEGLAVSCPLAGLRGGTRADEPLKRVAPFERVDVEVEHGLHSDGFPSALSQNCQPHATRRMRR